MEAATNHTQVMIIILCVCVVLPPAAGFFVGAFVLVQVRVMLQLRVCVCR